MHAKVLLYLHTFSLRFHLAYKAGFDVFAFIDRAANEGFAGVCISANDANYRHLGGKEPWRLAPIKERLEYQKLRCDMDTSSTKPEHLIRKLKIAKAIGAQQLRTYTRYTGKMSEIIEQTIKDLKEVAPVAQDLGVRVLLENHETFTGNNIVQILKAVNSPWVRALYDYGNSQMVLEDPLDCLAVMAPYAMSAHLKDHVMIRAEDSPDGCLRVLGVPIGDGHLPIIDITKKLLETGCHRIVFENSYGYHAPVKPEHMAQSKLKQLGHDSFAYAQNPQADHEAYLLEETKLEPDKLIALEDAMHMRTLNWLRQTFREQGWL